jgi:prepilin-type N-terminal cleavage/methylation domain-containing protein
MSTKERTVSTSAFRTTIARPGERGYSIPELLVVIAIIGISVAIGIPLAAEQMRQAKIRGAVDQLAMDLRAARMIAVSTRSPGLDFTIMTEPDNYYEYQDNKGNTRHVDMPDGVRITASDSPITFQLNGSIAADATTVMEIDLSGDVIWRWTIRTSVLGVSRIEDPVRIAS